MPGLEENPKTSQILQVSDPEDQQQPAPLPQENTQPTRELTQTDVLNSRLLKSFLNRMNTGDVASKFNNPPESPQTASEFDD